MSHCEMNGCCSLSSAHHEKAKSCLSSKDKRRLREEKKARIATSLMVVNKAKLLENPLEKFTPFTRFNRNDLSVKISFHRSADVDVPTWNVLFDLERLNMKDLYNACDWGYREKEKRQEMKDDSARYLIAREEDGSISAFSHFRFDLDFEEEVLYCYELQLVERARRKGLGKFMMQILELLAFSNDMKKVVLTVLRHNTDAYNFFTFMNYEVDETDADYASHVILSKKNKKLRACK